MHDITYDFKEMTECQHSNVSFYKVLIAYSIYIHIYIHSPSKTKLYLRNNKDNQVIT